MRPAQEVMGDLAAAGLTPDQLRLVMELSAALAVEARPTLDQAAENKRAYDREYRRAHRKDRTTSYETHETDDKGSLEVPPLASPLPKPSKSSPLSPPKKKSVELPDWLPPDEWAAFLEMRKAMRSVPFTEVAKRGIIADLDKLRGEGHDVAKVLTKAVKGGYRGVFGNEQTKAAHTAPAKPLTTDDAKRMEQFYAQRGDTKNAEEMRRRYPAAFGSIAAKIAAGVSNYPTKPVE